MRKEGTPGAEGQGPKVMSLPEVAGGGQGTQGEPTKIPPEIHRPSPLLPDYSCAAGVRGAEHRLVRVEEGILRRRRGLERKHFVRMVSGRDGSAHAAGESWRGRLHSAHAGILYQENPLD